MVSAAKAFSKEPPRQPLTSLEAIVEDFQWRYVDRLKTDQVIEWCRIAPDFPTAVVRAVEARAENGKHHNHQSKVDITARRKFGRKIIRAAQAGRVPLHNFDAMHDWMNENRLPGVGPVTVYDTAIRVAAYVEIEPTSVYLHAGVRQGLRALADALVRTRNTDYIHVLDPRGSKIPVKWFPEPLNKMKADDVEDILCTYREVFDSW